MRKIAAFFGSGLKIYDEHGITLVYSENRENFYVAMISLLCKGKHLGWGASVRVMKLEN